MLFDAVICRIEVLSEDTKLFVIRPLHDEDWISSDPGSHIDINVLGEFTRQYSLFDLEEKGRYTVAVKRSGRNGGLSEFMHKAVEGDRLRISEPRNRFVLGAPGKAVLFAAGIGITPIYSMHQRLRARGVDHCLHFFRRQPMLFNRRLEAGVNDGTVCLYDGFPSVQVAKTIRRLLEADCTPDTHVFACGPVGFMDIVVEHSLLRLPPANVHIERFQPLPEAKAETKPFEVVLARSGVTCRVGAGETILEALAKHSVKVDASCREGICGACLTRVLQGAPDHRDSFMTEGERLANEDICLCVSRSLTPSLVLDL